MLKKQSVNSKFLGREERQGIKIKYTQFVFHDAVLYWVYLIFFLCSVVGNMSLSSFPAIIEIIEKELGLEDNESAIGFFTTMQYMGSCCGKDF